MKIKIISPGVLTTVQDLGRFGYQQYGVPVSGVCDPFAAKLANILVGNPQEAALLECTMLGPVIEFLDHGVFAVSGAEVTPVLDGEELLVNTATRAFKGQKLSFRMPSAGLRFYVAFTGGIDVPLLMGSRSTFVKTKEGGFQGRKLEAGDVLTIADAPLPGPDLSRHYGGNGFMAKPCHDIRVVLGPQDDYFTPAGLDTFLTQTYSVTASSDRMGMRLDGPVIEAKAGYDIISDGINMGAVQVANGKPIILLADRQTTGGYTKIANVITVDLPVLAQLKAGDRIRFRTVSMEEAQELYVREAEALEGFEKWLKL